MADLALCAPPRPAAVAARGGPGLVLIRPPIRPPARDQPSPEETAELVASLRAAVLQARELAGTQVVRAPGGGAAVRVGLDGPRVRLLRAEAGEIVARRKLDAAGLLDHLTTHGYSFEALAALVTPPTDDRPDGTADGNGSRGEGFSGEGFSGEGFSGKHAGD